MRVTTSERAVAAYGLAAFASLAAAVINGVFGTIMAWTLVRYRNSDSYRDNYFFLLILPTFLLAKQLMLSAEHFQIGIAMATGLFRMAFLVMLVTALFAVPLGVSAGIYLEEYAPRNRMTALIEININNLAGVPSLLYGFLGRQRFARPPDRPQLQPRAGRHPPRLAGAPAQLQPVPEDAVSYTHLRAHATVLDLACRLLL